MQINIKHYDFVLTEAIKNYAESKLISIEKHFKNGDGMLNVSIGKNNKHHKNGDMYEVKLDIKKGDIMLHVEAISEDVYKSIDEARDKLDYELAKGRDKKRSVFNNLGRKFKELIKRGE